MYTHINTQQTHACVERNVPTVRLTNPTVKVPSATDTMELDKLKPHVTDTGRTLLKVPPLSEALGCKLVDRNRHACHENRVPKRSHN